MNRDSPEVLGERLRRENLFASLCRQAEPSSTPPLLIKNLGIHRGQQGIYRDLEQTQHLAPSGIALALRHTGASYADDLSNDGVIYHYPATNRVGRDEAEIDSLKEAQRLGLPVFVIVTPENTKARDIRLGWVVNHDDDLGWAFVSFEAKSSEGIGADDESEFTLIEQRLGRKVLTKARAGQAKFKFDVFARYGAMCAACGLNQVELLQAAHLCPVSKNGTNHAMNGLVLCMNHHRALDLGLLRIRPESFEFVSREDTAGDLEQLGVRVRSLMSLRNRPHKKAVKWLWENFQPPAAAIRSPTTCPPASG